MARVLTKNHIQEVRHIFRTAGWKRGPGGDLDSEDRVCHEKGGCLGETLAEVVGGRRIHFYRDDEPGVQDALRDFMELSDIPYGPLVDTTSDIPTVDIIYSIWSWNDKKANLSDVLIQLDLVESRLGEQDSEET